MIAHQASATQARIQIDWFNFEQQTALIFKGSVK